MDGMTILASILFAAGTFICCTNFYLSFIRYPLCLFLRREYEFVSGFPVIGQLLIVISIALFPHRASTLLWAGMVLALLDTGGVHWFIWGLVGGCELFQGKKTSD